MLTRLLDDLLPAAVLVALVFAMASSFGALSTTTAPRVVALERAVITGQRELPATGVAQAASTAAPEGRVALR